MADLKTDTPNPQTGTDNQQSSPGQNAPAQSNTAAPAPAQTTLPLFQFTGVINPVVRISNPSAGGRIFLGVKENLGHDFKLVEMAGVEGVVRLTDDPQPKRKSARSVATVALETPKVSLFGKKITGVAGLAFGDVADVRRDGSAIDKANELNGFVGLKTDDLYSRSKSFSTSHFGEIKIGAQHIRADFIAATSGDNTTVSAKVRGVAISSSLLGGIGPYVEVRRGIKPLETIVGANYEFPSDLKSVIRKKAGEYASEAPKDPSKGPGFGQRLAKRVEKMLTPKSEKNAKDD